MKTILLVLILSFSVNRFHLLAQQSPDRSITGIVTDESNSPLIFAIVKAKDLPISTTTDLQGWFSLIIPDSCKFLVFSYPGYEMLDFNIEGKDTIKVVLKGGIILTETVITAYAVPLIEQDNTTQGGIVSGRQTRNRPTKNINALAATTAGLSSIDGGDISIRGSRSNATDYYLDGIRVNASLIPQSEIEQLQVITGGIEARYGDVTGGLISLTSKG